MSELSIILAASVFSDPTFWTAMAFIAFVLLAGKKIWGAMAAGLDDRAEKIKADIEEARKLREEAQHMLAEYQRKQRDAVKEAEGIVEHAKEEAERLREKAEKDLEDSLARREQQAKDRIAQAEGNAVEEVRAAAAELAVSAARKILEDKLDDKAGGALVDDAIKALPEKLH